MPAITDISSDILAGSSVSPTHDELVGLLQAQRRAFHAEGIASADVRRNRIDRLVTAVLRNADALTDAISADFGRRPAALSAAVDVLGMLGDAEDIRANLEQWMADVPLEHGARIQQRPLGVVAVIGAWNFPVTLVVQPAIAALAAGNRVMIKMPSTTSRTAEALRVAVAELFDPTELVVVTGEGRVNDDFVALPFDHIMFTGSPKIGAIVQQAAGKNLVPVTLELGGKNPAIVSASADVEQAADRVAISRMANGGQICMCADYALVHRSVAEEFVDQIQERLRFYFPTYLSNPATVSLNSERAFDRIVGLVEDARARGARVIQIVAANESTRLPDRSLRLVPPTILLDVPEDAEIERDEIFGPVLPIRVFDHLDDVIDIVNGRPAPLASYFYGKDDAEFERFCKYTTSGGVTRNDGFLHGGVHGAPFGGVGSSGHGAYHGKSGFDTFTHRRTIAESHSPEATLGQLTGEGLNSPELQAGMAYGIQQVRSLWESRVATGDNVGPAAR